MTEAWIMCDVFEDQREENRLSPNVPVSHEELAELGILYRKLDPVTMLEPTIEVGEEITTRTIKEADGTEVEITTKTKKRISEVDNFMGKMGYKTRDEVYCCPGKLENYEVRLKSFFEEHIHEDEEIRLIKDGVGYFDVRAKDDQRWIRIKVSAGDLIIVPAGCYHRFTMDKSDYTHAIRLFSEVPKWTPLNRSEKETAINAARVEYEHKFMLPTGHPQKIAEKTVWTGHGSGGGFSNLTSNVVINSPSEFDAVIRRLVRETSQKKSEDDCRFFKVDGSSPAASEAIKALSSSLTTSLEAKNAKISSKHLKLSSGSEIPYLIVLYFTGSHFPFKNGGESWCPDCVASDPIVNKQLSYVSENTTKILRKCCGGSGTCERATPDKPFSVSEEVLAELLSSGEENKESTHLKAAEDLFAEHPFAQISFVQCNVQRYSYLKNPEYPYRTHPFIQLSSIPTVMVLRVGLKGKAISAVVDQEGEGEAAHIPVDEAETESDVAVIGRYTDPLPEDWLTSILSKQFGPSKM